MIEAYQAWLEALAELEFQYGRTGFRRDSVDQREHHVQSLRESIRTELDQSPQVQGVTPA